MLEEEVLLHCNRAMGKVKLGWMQDAWWLQLQTYDAVELQLLLVSGRQQLCDHWMCMEHVCNAALFSCAGSLPLPGIRGGDPGLCCCCQHLLRAQVANSAFVAAAVTWVSQLTEHETKFLLCF